MDDPIYFSDSQVKRQQGKNLDDPLFSLLIRPFKNINPLLPDVQ